jgi:hypothetical protein
MFVDKVGWTDDLLDDLARELLGRILLKEM